MTNLCSLHWVTEVMTLHTVSRIMGKIPPSVVCLVFHHIWMSGCTQGWWAVKMYTLFVDNLWLYHHTPQTEVVITLLCAHSGFVGLPHWWSSSRLINKISTVSVILLLNLCIKTVYRHHCVCVCCLPLCAGVSLSGLYVMRVVTFLKT